MPATKVVLTSLHGKRVGLTFRGPLSGDLVVNGRTAITQDDDGRQRFIQKAPTTQNTTGTLTAAQILSGIITSTTAAAVTATMPLGTALEAALDLAVDEAIEFAVINTGGTNAITLAGNTGVTIVGNAVTAANNSHHYRLRKTALNTFVAYRI